MCRTQGGEAKSESVERKENDDGRIIFQYILSMFEGGIIKPIEKFLRWGKGAQGQEKATE
jgi:hypothetical protein